MAPPIGAAAAMGDFGDLGDEVEEDGERGRVEEEEEDGLRERDDEEDGVRGTVGRLEVEEEKDDAQGDPPAPGSPFPADLLPGAGAPKKAPGLRAK